MVTWLKQPMVVNSCRLKGHLPLANLDHEEKTKGGVAADSPFVHYSRMLNLELVSPVQITVRPVSATPRPAMFINPEVFLYGSSQV